MRCSDRMKQNFQNLGWLFILDTKTTQGNSVHSVSHLHSLLSKILRHCMTLIQPMSYFGTTAMITLISTSENLFEVSIGETALCWHPRPKAGAEWHIGNRASTSPGLSRPVPTFCFQELSFKSCIPIRLPTEGVQCHEMYSHSRIYI